MAYSSIKCGLAKTFLAKKVVGHTAHGGCVLVLSHDIQIDTFILDFRTAFDKVSHQMTKLLTS